MLIFVPLLTAVRFGLGVDEAHYMLYARYLDWSYFDHPALVGWTHFIFNLVFGETELSARLPAILMGYAGACVAYKIVRNRNISHKVALISVLAVTLTFQIFILHLFLLPDSFLLFFAGLLVLICDRIERDQMLSRENAIFIGVVLGFSALAKVTSILFVPGLIYCLMHTLGFRIFYRKNIYLAVLLAALGALPTVLWNYKHDWISFRYQLNHVLSGQSFFESFFQSLGLQLSLVTPWMWPIALFGFYLILRSKKEYFLRGTLVSFALFFIYASLRSTVLPHWTSVFYYYSLLFGFAHLYPRYQFPKWIFVFQSCLVAVLCSAFIFAWSTVFPDAIKEIYGWPEMMVKVEEELEQRPDAGFAVLNWTYAGRAGFYSHQFIPKDKLFVLDDRFDQFDLWNPRAPQGMNLLILSLSFDELDRSSVVCQKGLNSPQTYPVMMGARRLYSYSLTWCDQFQSRK